MLLSVKMLFYTLCTQFKCKSLLKIKRNGEYNFKKKSQGKYNSAYIAYSMG